MLSETSRLVSTLTRAIDDLEPAATKIETYFSIDDASADLKKIANCSEKIESNRDFLKNTAIPAINRKIEQIKREIEELEAEEKEKEISE